MHAALVEFVEDDRAERREQRIGLQPRRQHAFGRDEKPRARAEAALEPDLPADLAADGPASFICDAPRDGTRHHAARLKQHHGPIVGKRRRNAGRLPRAGLCGDDDGARAADTIEDGVEVRVDRKRNHGDWMGFIASP